jgi:hypothetical protein
MLYYLPFILPAVPFIVFKALHAGLCETQLFSRIFRTANLWIFLSQYNSGILPKTLVLTTYFSTSKQV